MPNKYNVCQLSWQVYFDAEAYRIMLPFFFFDCYIVFNLLYAGIQNGRYENVVGSHLKMSIFGNIF